MPQGYPDVGLVETPLEIIAAMHAHLSGPSHRCKECGALWKLNRGSERQPEGSWSLRSPSAGKCCDNVPMLVGATGQIEPLVDNSEDLVVRAKRVHDREEADEKQKEMQVMTDHQVVTDLLALFKGLKIHAWREAELTARNGAFPIYGAHVKVMVNVSAREADLVVTILERFLRSKWEALTLHTPVMIRQKTAMTSGTYRVVNISVSFLQHAVAYPLDPSKSGPGQLTKITYLTLSDLMPGDEFRDLQNQKLWLQDNTWTD